MINHKDTENAQSTQSVFLNIYILTDRLYPILMGDSMTLFKHEGHEATEENI